MKELDSILNGIDESWREIVANSLLSLDDEYLDFLIKNRGYFPDKFNFLNAFKTLSLKDTKYILFGQDPYPRKESANGYAFIDANVREIFSEKGLSKEVNRATSLRNFIKMLLLSERLLGEDDLSQGAIAKIDKSNLCKILDEVRLNFEKNGVLLLNMALVFTSKEKSKIHIKKWRAFLETFLKEIDSVDIEFILFGSVAKEIDKIKSSHSFKRHYFCHPYNVDFIYNKEAQRLFQPMSLLRRYYD